MARHRLVPMSRYVLTLVFFYRLLLNFVSVSFSFHFRFLFGCIFCLCFFVGFGFIIAWCVADLKLMLPVTVFQSGAVESSADGADGRGDEDVIAPLFIRRESIGRCHYGRDGWWCKEWAFCCCCCRCCCCCPVSCCWTIGTFWKSIASHAAKIT